MEFREAEVVELADKADVTSMTLPCGRIPIHAQNILVVRLVRKLGFTAIFSYHLPMSLTFKCVQESDV